MSNQSITDAMIKEIQELYHVHGMTVLGIAKELGISETTVRKHLDRQPQADGKVPPVINDDQVQMLINDYKRNRPIRSILNTYKISLVQLYDLLETHQVPSRAEQNKINREHAFLDAVVLYEDGAKLKEITARTGLSQSTFYREYYELRGEAGLRRGGRRVEDNDAETS